jgi:NADPH-dependent 2,4-dienoyl-CoA reductase/sulfur reductase-like enzyme
MVTAPEKGIVIVGGGLAAARTAEQLRRAGYAGPITVVGEEKHLPYDRPPLSKEVLHSGVDDVELKPIDFYRDKDIELRLGTAVIAVDTDAQTVTLADDSVLGYDKLIIATGLIPKRIPAFPELAGIRVLRTLDHARELRSDAAAARRAVIVGAGFIGCEVAASLRNLGIEVVLVEPQPTPLATVLGEQVGTLVSRLHRSEGVDVRAGVGVVDVIGDGNRVTKVLLSDGSEHDADLVLVGIGSRPATDWLAGSGIEVDNGVLCDNVGRTSAPNVWAVGDVASWRDASGHQVRVEHWSNVADQARAIVPALLGSDPPTTVVVPYFWSDQYDIKIQCLGEVKASDIVHLVEDDGRRFLAYYERDGVLVGVVGAGIPAAVMKCRAKIASRAPISDVLQ